MSSINTYQRTNEELLDVCAIAHAITFQDRCLGLEPLKPSKTHNLDVKGCLTGEAFSNSDTQSNTVLLPAYCSGVLAKITQNPSPLCLLASLSQAYDL